jgi:iron complex outermembrane receptor protein
VGDLILQKYNNACSVLVSRSIVLFMLSAASLAETALADTGNTPAYAEHETEEDFVGEIDTVISATRISQLLTESPSSITVIDQAMIQASGAIEIADVMRLVPGMQVSYPTGNRAAVSYHGYSDAFPRSMEVLVDGRAIYQPSFSDVDWMFLGVVLEDIERIEVIRGSNSPLYGSNAVDGVINIITKQPYQERGTFARATAGDMNTRNGVLRHGGTTGELDYRVTLNYQEADGFDGNLDSTNDDRRIKGISTRSIWNPRPSDEVDIQLGFSEGDLGAGAEPTHDPPPHDKDVISQYQFVKWRRALKDNADLSFKTYHNGYSSSDNYRDLLSHAFDVPPEVIPLLLIDDEHPDGRPDQKASYGTYDYKGHRYDTEVQYTSPHTGKLRAVIGAGARLDRFKSETLTNDNDWHDEVSERVFVNLGYRANSHLLLNLGLMGEASDQYSSYLSPRLGMNWLFNTEHSVRISYAKARRKPSLVEENFKWIFKLDDGTDYINNRLSDDLRPESLESFELGYVGYWLDRKLLLDAKVFKERTTDIIHSLIDRSAEQPFPAIPVSTSVFMNDGKRIVKGGEIMLKYQAGPRDFISLSYANMDVDVFVHRVFNRKNGKPAPFRDQDDAVPKHTISILGSLTLPMGFEVSGGFYRISDMEWLSNGDEVDDYNRVDGRIARRWKAGSTRMMLEGIVQNMGGDYTSFQDENTFETRAFARFSIAF